MAFDHHQNQNIWYPNVYDILSNLQKDRNNDMNIYIHMVYAPGMVYLPTKLGDFTMGRGCKNGNAAIDPRNPTKVSSARSMSGGWLSFNPSEMVNVWLLYG